MMNAERNDRGATPARTITGTAEGGFPARVTCSCGAVWLRPADDPHADTLTPWVEEHPCAHGALAGVLVTARN